MNPVVQRQKRLQAQNQVQPVNQGCQMVYFQTKNRNLGKFWRALEWKKLVYSVALWNILHLVYVFNGNLVFKWHCVIFSPVLVYCIKKNLATLRVNSIETSWGRSQKFVATLRSPNFRVTKNVLTAKFAPVN
jgi:hypothetical protein